MLLYFIAKYMFINLKNLHIRIKDIIKNKDIYIYNGTCRNLNLCLLQLAFNVIADTSQYLCQFIIENPMLYEIGLVVGPSHAYMRVREALYIIDFYVDSCNRIA